MQQTHNSGCIVKGDFTASSQNVTDKTDKETLILLSQHAPQVLIISSCLMVQIKG